MTAVELPAETVTLAAIPLCVVFTGETRPQVPGSNAKSFRKTKHGPALRVTLTSEHIGNRRLSDADLHGEFRLSRSAAFHHAPESCRKCLLFPIHVVQRVARLLGVAGFAFLEFLKIRAKLALVGIGKEGVRKRDQSHVAIVVIRGWVVQNL
jgi:hypothetical protein